MVSSVNAAGLVGKTVAEQRAQYERKFSPCKTATSATFGAVGLKLANDAVLRKNASKTISLLQGVNADEFIATNNLSKDAVKSAIENAQQTLTSTQYLSKIKEAVKSPSSVVDKVKNWATNVNIREIPANLKKYVSKTIEGLKTSAKSLKGETLSATLKNVLNATKTAKGKNVLTLATGALCGLMLFGTSKIVKKHDKNQA